MGYKMEMRGNMELQKPISQSDLKPCPFCGGQPRIRIKSFCEYTDFMTAEIECVNCNLEMKEHFFQSLKLYQKLMWKGGLRSSE